MQGSIKKRKKRERQSKRARGTPGKAGGEEQGEGGPGTRPSLTTQLLSERDEGQNLPEKKKWFSEAGPRERE